MSGETQDAAAGGPQTGGWGTGWLPERIARRAALDDAREAREAREAEAERERRAEERHNRAVADYMADCQARGEQVDALALASGRLPGRTVADVLASARAAGDLDDRRTELRLHREGYGEPQKLHIEFGEPVIHGAPAARSGWLAVWHRNRRFTEWQQKRAEAEAARAALDSELDYGLVCERRERRD